MITIEKFGKDHWSTFAYAETLVVEHSGIISPNPLKMRTNHKTHPYIMNPIDGSIYPTILSDGSELQGHDDWDCLDDCVKAGLLKSIGTGFNPIYKLTEKGKQIVNLLREHKSQGGTFKNFNETLRNK